VTLTLAQIMHIPRLSERLECVIYRRKLELELTETLPDLNMVRNAGAEIQGSKRLKRVLGVSDTNNDQRFI
jgi:diaphanous 1